MTRQGWSAYTSGLLAAVLNGELVDPDEPHILLDDRALTVGEGVFETLTTVGASAFAVTRHVARLRASAAVLGLPIDCSDDDLRAWLDVVIRAAHASQPAPTPLRLRITVLGGPGPAGTTTRSEGPIVTVTAAPIPSWAPSEAVARSPWPRNEHAPTAGAKTTAYADNIVVARWAVAQGAGEALMANLAGNLCEATAANVFVEVDGVLVTPTLASGCLGGVTRALLLELGVAEERDVPFEVLDRTSEAFLSSTTRHVHPIAAIDGVALPTCPGPLTQAAADAFAHLLATTPDP